MTKKIFITIFVSLFITEVYAEKINCNISYGRAYLNMQDANEELRDTKQSLEDLVRSIYNIVSGTTTSSLTEFKEGDNFSGFLTYVINDKYSVGIKAAYLTSNAQILVKGNARVLNQDLYTTIDVPMTTNLTSIMIGNSYLFTTTDKIKILGLLWFGYSYAYFNGTIKRESTNREPQSDSFSYKGENLSYEVAINLQYMLSKDFSVGLEIGYRNAKINELKATKDVPNINIKEGDTLKSNDGKTIPFDYTGTNIALTFSIRF